MTLSAQERLLLEKDDTSCLSKVDCSKEAGMALLHK
jgi:hypothetical protein